MSRRPPDLIMVGPPGAGKSTLACRLAADLGFARLSPGTLMRRLATEDSAVGRHIRDILADGGLVPDEVVDEVVRRRLSDMPPEQGVIMDGYPRTAAQAETLRRLFAETGRLRRRPLVLRLCVPADDLLARLHWRRDLERRTDDADDVISRRLQIYDTEAPPILEVLSDWADVVTINGAQPPEAVTRELLEKLNARRNRMAIPAPGCRGHR
jgi:adenylate kinase